MGIHTSGAFLDGLGSGVALDSFSGAPAVVALGHLKGQGAFLLFC